MEFFHGGSDVGILIIVGVLGYFFKKQLEIYDMKHEKHFEHAVDMTMHETDRERESIRASYRNDRNEVAAELIRHTQQDDKRFDRMEQKMDIMAEDIKDILKAVQK